jgi:TfoX/Sxy family transcriptional regulator of competence genes
MTYNEQLVNRVREALSHQHLVEEKKMFRGICFMVNGKMCVCVRDDEMMCRIDPALHNTVLEQNGCREMVHNGRVMRGFVYVGEEGTKRKKDFDYWIGLALAFNVFAQPAKKKKK